MSKFDRSKVKQIHKDINDALQLIAKKHGMHSLRTGTLSFDDAKFTVRVTGVSSLSAFTSTSDVIKPAITTNPLSLMDKTFISPTGKKFTVCDYQPSNRKYPIIAKNDSGTRYKFTMSQVTQNLIK